MILSWCLPWSKWQI